MSDLPSNPEVAAVFEELAQRLALIESSPYRWMAFRRAAQTIAALEESAAVRAARGDLGEVPGIGAATVEKVTAFVQTGSFPALDRAREAVPDALLELTRVPGVGTKTATKIWKALTEATANIHTFDDLQEAVLEHRSAMTGIRPQLLDAIAIHAPMLPPALGGTVRRDAAQAAFTGLATALDCLPEQVLEAGGLTRGDEVIDEVVAVISDADSSAEDVTSRLAERGWRVTATTATSVQATAPSGAAVRIMVCEPSACTTTWSQELGKEARLRQEDTGLVSVADLRADLHTHTDWSDGSGSLQEMVDAAMKRGLTIYAITDHSAPYALVNGLDAHRIAEQRRAVERLQAEQGTAIEIWCGSEVEVLADGTLGLDDETLATLDWVVASIHTQQRMGAAELQARYERVLSNPLVDCIGHPTGRLLLRREPMAINVDWLIERAAATGTMLELNANPRRLDLGAAHVAAAVDAGVPIAINTDAHNAASLDLQQHGVAVARKAGLKPEHVVNCWDAATIQGRRPRNR